jgi:hypothetical protein
VTPGRRPARRCPHTPTCPASSDPNRLAAVIVAAHPEQGWYLLCNGVVLFDDSGYLSALADIDPACAA